MEGFTVAKDGKFVALMTLAEIKESGYGKAGKVAINYALKMIDIEPVISRKVSI